MTVALGTIKVPATGSVEPGVVNTGTGGQAAGLDQAEGPAAQSGLWVVMFLADRPDLRTAGPDRYAVPEPADPFRSATSGAARPRERTCTGGCGAARGGYEDNLVVTATPIGLAK